MTGPRDALLDALYNALPTLRCQRKCQESCGPIVMSRREWERIIERIGYEPVGDETLICPLLDQHGRCTVYDIRPLICRLWGTVQKMKCPWGCVPAEWLTDAQAHALLRQAEVISGA